MMQIRADRNALWSKRLARSVRAVDRLAPPPVEGRLTRMVGLALEAVGSQAAIGDSCEVLTGESGSITAEVVGFSGDRLFLMPAGDSHGLGPDARVIPRQSAGMVRVGPQLLGRIVDGA